MLDGNFGTKNAAGSVNVKFNPPRIVWGLCAAVVILITVLCVMNRKTTIDLNEYLTIEEEGFDGYGTARARIDWQAIEAKYGSRVSFTKEAENQLGGFLMLTNPMMAIEADVDINLDKTNGLSNGDIVSYTWRIDEELEKYVDCKVKCKDGTVTVSKLDKVSTFDAFDGVDLYFSGISPSGALTITSQLKNGLNAYDYTCDKSVGLRNGDTVTLKLKITDPQHYAEMIGRIPDAMSKTFTVSGLDEYVAAYSDLTEDFLAEVKSEAEDTIYAYAAKMYGKGKSLNNLEYAGYAFNSIKDGSSYVMSYNTLYIIYKGDVSSSTGGFSTAKIYFPVKIVNILKDKNGELSYSSNEGITGMSIMDDGWNATQGYANPLSCYMEIAESERDNYNVECGDGFEIYSSYEPIEHLSDIDESYKETLRTDARDRIESYIASDYSEGSAAENLAYEGEYLLVAKSQGNNFEYNNAYVVVYSATVSSADGYFDTATVHFPVEYNGIVNIPDDTYTVSSVEGIVGNTKLSDSWYYTRGYTDGRLMYSDIITSRRDRYIYEVSDGLKEFGGNTANPEKEEVRDKEAPSSVEEDSEGIYDSFLQDYVEFLSGRRSVSEEEKNRSGSIYLGFKGDDGYFAFGGTNNYFEQTGDDSARLHIKYAFTDLNGDNIPELVIRHDYMGTKTTIFKAGEPYPEVLDFSMMFGSLVIYDNNLIGDFSSTTRSRTYYRMTEEGVLEAVEEPTDRRPEKELKWHEI